MGAARVGVTRLPQTIETILFDFGGTLDADGVAWKDRFHAHYASEGLVMTPNAFAPAFYAADDPLIGGLSPSAGLEETVSVLAANLEAQLEVRDPVRGAERADDGRGRRVAERFLSDAWIVFARNRPVLEALAGRYRLGIVSNFYGNLEAVCESSGLAPFFGVMTDSHRVGASKPDPAIFHAALDALGAASETTLFVGDSLRATARARGARA